MTTLNASLIDNPALWRLSIMLRADGIDVLLRRELGEAEVIHAHLDADPAVERTAHAVEELFYANPVLLKQFRKVDLVADGGFTLVVPVDTALSDIDGLFPDETAPAMLSADIDSADKLAFRLDRGLHNFLGRTFGEVAITHSLAVLSRYFLNRSRLGNSSKMFVDIEASTMNAFIFSQGRLAMASSYVCPDINDAAYFALAAANTAGFDFTDDEILIAGHAERRSLLMPVLRQFARNVMPAIFPSQAVGMDNGATMSAPFTLAILPLCE